MKKTSIPGLALTLSLFVGAQLPTAHAQLITINGNNIQITANGFSASNLGSGAPGALIGTAGFIESAWGIFQITSIVDGTNSPVFADNLGTEYWGMFYNAYDTSSIVAGSTILFTSKDLQLDIYKLTTPDPLNANFINLANLGTAPRTSLSTFTGITNVGTPVFRSKLFGDLTSTFNTNNGNTNANGVLQVTYDNMFDTGAYYLTTLNFSLGGTTIPDVAADWNVNFGGTIRGELTPVPEPSTYGFMAVATLAGIVALRRRGRPPVVVMA